MRRFCTFLSVLMLLTVLPLTGVEASDYEPVLAADTSEGTIVDPLLTNDETVVSDTYEIKGTDGLVQVPSNPINSNIKSEVAAQLNEKNRTVVGENIKKRTSHTKHYLMSDGSYKAVISSNDVHYTDENGAFQDIDTSLTDEADLDLIPDQGSVSADSAADFKSIVKKNKENRKLKSLDKSDTNYRALRVPYDVSIPKNIQKGYSISKSGETMAFIPVGASKSKGIASNNSVFYSNVWTDTDVRLDVQNDGIKESIVLNSPNSPTTFSFQMQTNSALQSIQHLNLLPAWAKDNNGKVIEVAQTMRQENGASFIDLNIDAAGVAFPVIIDPTVQIANETQDTYVMANSPDSRIYGRTELWVGSPFDCYCRIDSFIQFDLSSIPSDSTILDAKLNLITTYDNFTKPGNGYINLHRVTSYWNEAITWNTTPGINELVSETVIPLMTRSGQQFDFDIKSAVTNWVNGTWTNYGLRMMSYSDFYFTFYNNNWPDHAPKLTITYEQKPVSPQVLYPNGGEVVDALYNITWNSASDPDTVQSQLKYQAQLSQDGGMNWTDLAALTAASQTQLSYDFTSKTASTNSLIRVRAFDGTNYGPWDQSDAPFTIKHNIAPSKPTGLSPGNTASASATIVIGSPILKWNFADSDAGDTQSAYQIVIYNGTTVVKDTGWVTSSLSTYTVPSGTLTRDTTYNWKIRTKDRAGAISAYTSLYYIKVNALPVVAVTSYTNGQQLSDNILTFTWTYSDANSQAQSKYQVTGSRDNWATVGFNSGVLNGNATTYTTPALASGTWSFKVTAYDGLEWATAAIRSNLVLSNAFEPNDTNAQAFAITYNQSYSSLVNSATDVDFFKFTATSNEIDRLILNVPSGLNYDVYIYDSSMKLITAGVQGTAIQENELFDVKAGSTYYIKIVSVGGSFSTTAAYNFTLAPATMKFNTTYQYDSNGNTTSKTTVTTP
ncbi:DNRLRE domain-containing protein [Paenibacillus kobensis]|uniref:DNRLRE domain-containing protein n=1 Tax=Paenibacillus kobensis TaxID=59841 RepID=UPI001FE436B8|nr:DNRLRE domain-containing protein [Paenibacillus kobensis]